MPSLLPSPRCALTAPFHPYRLPTAFTVKSLGGLLSVALSVGSRPPGVTWHLIRRSPDFPPPGCTRQLSPSVAAEQRLPGRLPGRHHSADQQEVNFIIHGSSTARTPHSATHRSVAPQSRRLAPAATPSPATPQRVSTAVSQQCRVPPAPH